MAKKINKKFGPSLYNTKVKDPYGKSVVNKPSNSKKKPYGMASKTSDEKKVVKKVETKKPVTVVNAKGKTIYDPKARTITTYDKKGKTVVDNKIGSSTRGTTTYNKKGSIRKAVGEVYDYAIKNKKGTVVTSGRSGPNDERGPIAQVRNKKGDRMLSDSESKKAYAKAIGKKVVTKKPEVKKVETKKNKTLVESINDWADRTFRDSANSYAEKINKVLDKNFRDPVNKYADKKLREPANKIADKINKVLDKNFRDPINNAIRGKKTETKKSEAKKVKSTIESLKRPDIRKKTIKPEVVVKPKTPSVSQLWQEKTGTSWSEAKKQGLTDGSASSNIALMKKLKSGEISKSSLSKPKTESTPTSVTPTPTPKPTPYAGSGMGAIERADREFEEQGFKRGGSVKKMRKKIAIKRKK